MQTDFARFSRWATNPITSVRIRERQMAEEKTMLPPKQRWSNAATKQATRNWRKHGTDCPLGPTGVAQHCQHFNFGPVTLNIRDLASSTVRVNFYCLKSQDHGNMLQQLEETNTWLQGKNSYFSFLSREKPSSSLPFVSLPWISLTTQTTLHFWHFWSPNMWRLPPHQQLFLGHWHGVQEFNLIPTLSIQRGLSPTGLLPTPTSDASWKPRLSPVFLTNQL